MKLHIKRVSSLDIGALREMSKDFLAEVPFEYPKMDDAELDAHMMEILTGINDPNFVALIAYDGKKPAGFFVGYVGNKPYSQPRRVGVAQELYVVPEKRSGIVGLALMETACNLSIAQGAQGIECVGLPGKGFERWEKFGFKAHTIYGYMNNEDFLAITQRFTHGRQPNEGPQKASN